MNPMTPVTPVRSLASAASWYASAGWPVHPLRPRDKIPATEHGFLDATTDLTQIEAWWSRHPDFNIGVATGYQFDVVDFDSIDSLETLLTDIDASAGNLDGPTCLTARGSHTYVLPSGRNTLKLRDGIDYKAIGGYVLAPPSVHPDGPVYSWLEGFGPRYPATTVPASFFPAPKVIEPPREVRPRPDGLLLPGDRYNASGALLDLLKAHGWTYTGSRGSNQFWRRPGKDRGQHSASWNGKHFYIFSSNAGLLEQHTAYSPFAVYATLEHGGNFSAAAAALRLEEDT